MRTLPSQLFSLIKVRMNDVIEEKYRRQWYRQGTNDADLECNCVGEIEGEVTLLSSGAGRRSGIWARLRDWFSFGINPLELHFTRLSHLHRGSWRGGAADRYRPRTHVSADEVCRFQAKTFDVGPGVFSGYVGRRGAADNGRQGTFPGRIWWAFGAHQVHAVVFSGEATE